MMVHPSSSTSVAILYLCTCMTSSAFVFETATASRRTRFARPLLTQLGATWSNGQAIKEYQDFLSTGKSGPDETRDGGSVIMTDGTNPNLAAALVKLGMGDDLVIDIDVTGDSNAWPALPTTMSDYGEEYPVYVAVSPHSLDSLLTKLPEGYKAKYGDLVFFSGGAACGCIEPILRRRGFCHDYNTQVLVSGMTLPDGNYFPLDQSFQIGLDKRGQEKWTGECASCGKWNGAVAERLLRNNIRCKVGFYREWRRLMWERAIFDAVFPLVGAVRDERTTFTDVALYYAEEVAEMLWQISMLLRGTLAITMTYGFEERLFDLAEFKGKETVCVLDPNMYNYTYQMFEKGAPLMAEYLVFAKQSKGLLEGMELPETVLNQKKEENPIMRQGNLRADGVV
eukprot:CAMPEP_0195522514 /NCGR_PEP_ID=MMETSP0794_2-20130614/20755_1 /TAXON_ID=515487 /ORGANISM="Stephanopyxis turris, Strain CCMP 815" /LENGTH=395 /DNA_ID=CAMNT_0040652285 /DNA_START=69 /DNA_END=1256 /DNA_ORIENTATION=+